jgi:hypothetical protein
MTSIDRTGLAQVWSRLEHENVSRCIFRDDDYTHEEVAALKGLKGERIIASVVEWLSFCCRCVFFCYIHACSERN